MNIALQKHIIAGLLEKNGIERDLVDLDAHIDDTLRLDENIRNIEGIIKQDLQKNELDPDFLMKYTDDGNHEQAKSQIEKITEEKGLEETLDIFLSGKDPILNDIEKQYSTQFILSYLHELGIPKEKIISKVMNIEGEIVELVKKKPKYADLLRNIISYEEKYGDAWKSESQGWEWDSIKGAQPGNLAYLVSKGIIRKVYDSSNYTEYRINDIETVKKVLEKVEKESKEIEEKKIKEVTPFEEPGNEEIDEFKRIIKEKDALNYWSEYINPKIGGMEKHKKAILLSLVSLNDKFGDRGRIHVLFYGDPGTAKTRLAHWTASKLGHAEVSHRTSEVGLTGDMRGDEITMGDLPLAHKKHLIIDELDKFGKRDRYGLLESMSDGKVTLSGGGKKASFKAEATVIASANKIDVLDPELIDRFDFRLECRSPHKEKGKQIITEIVQNWGRDKKDYSGTKLRRYLSWVKEFTPNISDEVRKEVSKFLSDYIDKKEKEEVKIRQYERFIRIGMAIARLNRRDLEVEDVVRAVSLVNGDVLLSNGVF